MNLQRLNETLKQILNEFQINEMVIKYGEKLGETNSLLDAINNILKKRLGHYTTNSNLRIKSMVTDKEIEAGLYNKVLKGIEVEKKCPITIVWGEPDILKRNKHLEGHGIVHILQGHSKDFSTLKTNIDKAIVNEAKLDSKGNYSIDYGKFRYSFAVYFDEKGSPKEAIWLTGLIRN